MLPSSIASCSLAKTENHRAQIKISLPLQKNRNKPCDQLHKTVETRTMKDTSTPLIASAKLRLVITGFTNSIVKLKMPKITQLFSFLIFQFVYSGYLCVVMFTVVANYLDLRIFVRNTYCLLDFDVIFV